MKKNIILFSSAVFFLMGCTNEKGELPLAVTPNACSPVSYSVTIAPLIATNCAIPSCHNSGSGYGDFSTYAGVKFYSDNGEIKKRAVDNPTMPPTAPLPESERNKINCWIMNGAQNN